MTAPSEELQLTLKRAGSVLKQNGIPFALIGGFATYARGGATSQHDVDFILKEEDAGRALEVLGDAGFTTERPPEDWLVKAYDKGLLVDLIFRPVEQPVTDATLAEAEPICISGINLPVMPATTLMIHKLMPLNENNCDFSRVLPLARSLREQIDWPRVRDETKESPYAQAFLVLVDMLNIWRENDGKA